MVEYLSSSQINLFINCSLKYKFRYIDKIPVRFKSSGLAFGSVIHSALSWFHKRRMNGIEVNLKELFRIFDADWYAQKVDTDIRYKGGEDEMKLNILGKELLEKTRTFTIPAVSMFTRVTVNGFTIPAVNSFTTPHRNDLNLLL